MKLKRICIDVSNIIPGKGGSGGGIATYALNLIKGLNETNAGNNFKVYVIKNPGFAGLENLHNINIIDTKIDSKKLLGRFFWIHFYLPFFCVKHKINLLQRVTPELPFIKVCKYVCTLHDLMFEYYLEHKEIRKSLTRFDILKYKLLMLIGKQAVTVSDDVIVPSDTIKNDLVKNHGVRSNKVTVTHLASEIIKKPVVSLSGNIDNKLRIGVIAGFYPHKGHKKVIALAKKILENGFTNFKISFRGHRAFEHYFEEVKSIIEKLNLNDHIVIESYNEKASLSEIYSSFDVVLLLSEYEGFGLPVLEAQAHNLPVFCSDIPVFREVLEDSAYFIKDDNNLNVNKLIENLKNTSLHNFLKVKGQNNIKRFSWQKTSLETYAIYKKLIPVL